MTIWKLSKDQIEDLKDQIVGRFEALGISATIEYDNYNQMMAYTDLVSEDDNSVQESRIQNAFLAPVGEVDVSPDLQQLYDGSSLAVYLNIYDTGDGFIYDEDPEDSYLEYDDEGEDDDCDRRDDYRDDDEDYTELYY